MEIKLVYADPNEFTLSGIAEKYKLTLEVCERDQLPFNDPARFYAHFERVDVVGDGCLIGTYGDGKTPLEAVKNYVKEISGKHIKTWSKVDIWLPVLKGVGSIKAKDLEISKGC